MTKRTALFAVLLIASPIIGQKRDAKKEQKPAVHSDFQFGGYPLTREATEEMSSEQARLLVAAYAAGWDIEKLVKNSKFSADELNKTSDKLEDDRLLRRDEDYHELRPGMAVIRERDYERIVDGLKKHTDEFSKLLQSHWPEIETMVTGLNGSKGTPKERLMYETVVSGILLGGLVDALWEDKTLLPPPPRRNKNGTERFYAWLVESNPTAAGKLKREIHESDNYRIISVGTELPAERPDLDDLRGKATVYDDADAVKYRRFIAVFCRDTLLPWVKGHRAEFLAQGAKMSSGNYIAAAEAFAWYYNAMVNGVADDLSAAHRIAPPEKFYSYAVRIPQ